MLLPVLILVGNLFSFLVMALPQAALKRATWLWDARLITSGGDEVLNFAVSKRVGTIHLQINMDVNNATYRKFVSAALSRNIVVEALMGAPTWALPTQSQRIQDTIDWVTAYQNVSRNEQRFAGIHFDIEPYLLPEWQREQSRVVAGWQQAAQKLVATARLLNVPASADIPFWLHTVRTVDSSRTLDRWMINNCDSVTIMAYRNSSAGVLDVAQTALTESKAAGKRIWLGVETVQSAEGKHISFADFDEEYLEKQLMEAERLASSDPSFAGIAVHDYAGWKKLITR